MLGRAGASEGAAGGAPIGAVEWGAAFLVGATGTAFCTGCGVGFATRSGVRLSGAEEGALGIEACGAGGTGLGAIEAGAPCPDAVGTGLPAAAVTESFVPTDRFADSLPGGDLR